jgi:transcriptional regulator with XRE-family HTH domain
METLGPKIRKQRRRLGLSLDELSGRTGISKPYLSLIENSRVCNPPSDQKLTRLEQTLAFNSGELLIYAHLQRTPSDVRAILTHLLSRAKNGGDGPAILAAKSTAGDAVCLDTAVLCGALAELLDRGGDNVEPIAANAVPLVDRASIDDRRPCGDASFPQRVAGQFVGCPDIADNAAFAARVRGDCMMPKYRQGDIVIFSPALPPRDGDDCFIRLGDGQTTFKRIFFENDGVNGAASLRLVPRNERHRPTLIAREKVHGLYRAVYRYQRVDED